MGLVDFGKTYAHGAVNVHPPVLLTLNRLPPPGHHRQQPDLGAEGRADLRGALRLLPPFPLRLPPRVSTTVELQQQQEERVG